MNDFRTDRRSLIRRYAALLCVAVIAVITSVAAAHACQVFGPNGQQIRSGAAVSPDHGPCLICLSAHSPSLAAPFAAIPASLIQAEMAGARPLSERPSLQAFGLYVRPPPSV